MDGFLRRENAVEEKKDEVIETKIEVLETRSTSLSGEDALLGSKFNGPLVPSKAPAHPLISFWRRAQERARYHEVATQPSVFDNDVNNNNNNNDPATAARFAPPPSYENAHRFDPAFRWTWGEELPLVTRLDLRVALWSVCMFIVFDMNRSNLAQANTDNFLEDLGMDTNDFNLGNTVFRATTMSVEIPVQLLSRKVGL